MNENANHDEALEPRVIKCPHCDSTKWTCWDERSEWFEDENGELYEYPVGYMKCGDCGKSYLHAHNDDKHIGDYEEAFGREDDWDY